MLIFLHKLGFLIFSVYFICVHFFLYITEKETAWHIGFKNSQICRILVGARWWAQAWCQNRLVSPPPPQNGPLSTGHLLRHFMWCSKMQWFHLSSMLSLLPQLAFQWLSIKSCAHPDAPWQILRGAFQTLKICSQSFYRLCAPGTLWNRTSGWLAVNMYWMGGIQEINKRAKSGLSLGF